MVAWRVLQLADSAFPTGGFAHSGGLEAALQSGIVRGASGVRRFVEEAILAASTGALPLVGAAWDAELRAAGTAASSAFGAVDEIDAFTATTVWSHVAARASRAQGRALVDVAARAFAVPRLVALRARVLAEATPGHLAPMFGAVTRALDVTRDDALGTFLHLTARSLLSAAVRLGALGPTEAQSLHAELDGALDAALARGRALGIDDVAQPSPITELLQAAHDRLYTRLFQT